MARRHITLKDPSRFKDPAGLTWERYLAERAAIPADALAFRSVSAHYLERAVEQFANNFFPEEAATCYIATAAATRRSRSSSAAASSSSRTSSGTWRWIGTSSSVAEGATRPATSAMRARS